MAVLPINPPEYEIPYHRQTQNDAELRPGVHNTHYKLLTFWIILIRPSYENAPYSYGIHLPTMHMAQASFIKGNIHGSSENFLGRDSGLMVGLSHTHSPPSAKNSVEMSFVNLT